MSKSFKIAFAETPPGRDAQGKPYRRFFQFETLARALERAIELESVLFRQVVEIKKVEGDALKCRLDLLREDRIKLVFRMTLVAATGKRTAFTLLVAKNAEECAKPTSIQWGLLKALAARAPKLVLAPLDTGTVFLPDRHRRATHHREITVCIAEDLPGYWPISSNKHHQFVSLCIPPTALSIEETEQVKARVVELAARSFDPRERTALDVASLAPDDLLVRRGGAVTRLKLGGCRRLMQRATPAKILDGLQNATWNWGHGPFHPIPRDPALFIDALEKALGKTTAREWIETYLHRVRQGALPKRNPDYFDMLSEYVG